jgi:hypothetical protein
MLMGALSASRDGSQSAVYLKLFGLRRRAYRPAEFFALVGATSARSGRSTLLLVFRIPPDM